MKKIIISSVFAAMATFPVLALDLNLSVKDAGLRVLTAKEAPEGFGRGLPMGPSALHYAGTGLWAVDSIAGRLVEFDNSGKEVASLTVKDGDKLVISDFAMIADETGNSKGFWLVGSEKPEVIKIDNAGNVLASFSTDLNIQTRIEMLPGGRLAIFDQGMSAFAVYDETGRMLFKQSGIGSGIAVEKNGDILFLNLEEVGLEDKLFLCRRADVDGKIIKVCELPFAPESNPALLLGLDNGQVLIGFHSLDEESDEATYNICKVAADGNVTATMNTGFPAPFISRPVISSGSKLMLVSFVEENGQYLLRLSDLAEELIEEAAEG